ncbi:SecDF P1 head subdomain-containing protein [Actinokineospora iranica]|uniref:SecDF P1 head subdomain domain-containing protein n=1 Tax=Actinokineospora iranica TaxID=1271860 RepID=A0A1G6JIW8_9PSEU|nr:hypothetical protein [Actinokineospora iranica]SDC18631.1 hypothetical protein SAMN05216174_101425 [Actinokineospora iranica]
MQRNPLARALVTVFLVVLAGCSGQTSGDSAPGDAPGLGSGPVQARVAVELRPVLSVAEPEPGVSTAPKPDVLVGPDGAVYTLAPSIGDFTRLENVVAEDMRENGGGWVVTIRLPSDSARVFADWTSAHVDERLAIVVGDKLISAPTIMSPITGGTVQIAGDFTEQEAKRLAEDITGE